MPLDNRPVPTAPCPTCRRVASIDPTQIGSILRCPGCKTRYRTAPAPSAQETPDTAESSESVERSARSGNVYDEGYDRFDETAVPRSVTALAVMDFVYAGLMLMCGVLRPILLKISPSAMPGPTIEPRTFVYIYVVQGLTVAASVLLLLAGLTTLRRARSAQVLSIVALVVTSLLLVLNLVEIGLNYPRIGGAVGETFGVFTGVVSQMIFWLGYIITGVILCGSAFRTPTDSTP